MSEDLYRYCVYCKADCYEDEPEHGPDCPETTGLWPVTERDLGIRGPNDPYAHGMMCMDCKAEFKLGDFYAHRATGDTGALGAIEGPIYEIVCLGCAALTVELEP